MLESILSLALASELARGTTRIDEVKEVHAAAVAEAEAEARRAAQNSNAGSPAYNSGNSSNLRTITYDVSTRGTVVGDVGEFKRKVAEIYADSRGWKRAGVNFKYVESGGTMHVVLAQANEVPKFAPAACTADWSCTVYPYVIINDDRWMGATQSFNEVGETLEHYRQMVVNHETGHWLGHGHITTCGEGGYAPIMMQQSMTLRGCKPNPWPLNSETWASR